MPSIDVVAPIGILHNTACTWMCRPGIRPLFGQPLLILAFVLVREVETWSPLARPLAVAIVLEAEGGLEAGVAQQSTCVLCVCCACRPWQFMRTLWRLRYCVRPCLTDPDLFVVHL